MYSAAIYLLLLDPIQVIWLERNEWTTSTFFWFVPSNLLALYAIVLMLANEKIQILLLRAGHYMQFLDQVLITISGT